MFIEWATRQKTCQFKGKKGDQRNPCQVSQPLSTILVRALARGCTRVDRVICAEGLARGEKFRLRRLPERGCMVSVRRHKNPEVAELL